MSQQIITNNKLIAEFMQKGTEGFGIYDYGGNHVPLKDLHFHKDWNWLMPVVAKINNDVFCHTYERLSKVTEIRTAVGYAKIKFAYKKIIEFIKWYNKKGK